MIRTYARILKATFPSGRATDHLAAVVKKRFNIADLPEGFWYWPVQMGGLELRNPLVPLFCMRDSIRRSPDRILEKAFEEDEAAYLGAKDHYERNNKGLGLSGTYNTSLKGKVADVGDDFMTNEDILKYREQRSCNLAIAYNELLSIPLEKPLDNTTEIASMLDTLPKSMKKGAISRGFERMDSYWKWIVAVYGPEIKEKFGSLLMVNEGQVPLGVVSVMKAGKIRWRG